MVRRKLSPSEILERLQAVEAFAADGQPMAVALRTAGVLPVEYDQWRMEYAGLLRTLGPLAAAPPRLARRSRLAGSGRPAKTFK